MDSNPFKPPEDEEIFVLREREQEEKQAHRRQRQAQRVWEKGTAAAPVASRTKAELRQNATGRHAAAGSDPPMPTAGRGGREDMGNFVSKKREMFFVQMSLDIKRDEIRKLDERARVKDEALRKSERMLEEDAMRFDAFLKENDTKALLAMKDAEAISKKRQAVLAEVKKVAARIQVVQSDMTKLKDQLDQCMEYKGFLDRLTPEEFFQEHKRRKRDRQQARKQRRIQSRQLAWEESRDRAVEEAKEEEGRRIQALMDQGVGKRKAREKVKRVPPQIPPEPSFDDIVTTSSDEDLPMHFVDTQQLFDVFTELEEQTLFLIQNNQETEQALEELKQTHAEKKHSLEEQTSGLSEQLEALRAQIKEEEARSASLQTQIDSSSRDDPNQQLLEKLEGEVREVYEACGSEQQKKTLDMLTDLEAKLEDLLHRMETMDPAWVRAAEKEKQQARRERQREEHALGEQRKYEEKLAAQLRRAQEPVKKKTGKPVMQRSRPPRRRKKAESSAEQNEEEMLEQRYLN